MCTKHLNEGPLICQAPNSDENDGHTHQYASATGSWGDDKDKD